MVGVLLRHIRAGLGCGAAPQHYNGILLYNLHSATCTQLATTTQLKTISQQSAGKHEADKQQQELQLVVAVSWLHYIGQWCWW